MSEEMTPADRWHWEEGYLLPSELLTQFRVAVDELVGKMFGEGDRPVSIHIVDRTRCEGNHYIPLPYWHKAETVEQRRRILELALYNSRRANERLDQLLRSITPDMLAGTQPNE